MHHMGYDYLYILPNTESIEQSAMIAGCMIAQASLAHNGVLLASTSFCGIISAFLNWVEEVLGSNPN